MTEVSNILFEIHSKIDENTICVVKFAQASEAMIALDELDKILMIRKLREMILAIRTICMTEDTIVYIPKDDVDLPKARRVTVSVSATYPNGVPIDIILRTTGLKPAELSAYYSSKNNPTSKYLYVSGNLLHIRPEGISWLFGLLRKDKQIVFESD